MNFEVPGQFGRGFFLHLVMKKFSSTLLLFFSIISISQESPSDFSASINISPDLAYRNLILVGGDPSLQPAYENIYESRNERESPKLGFTCGVNLLWRMGNHYHLESGLNYSDRGYKIGWFEFPFPNSDPSIPDSLKYSYHFHYAVIPVKLIYNLNVNTLRVYTALSLNTGILITTRYKGFYKYDDGHEEKIKGTEGDFFRRLSVTPAAHIGLNIPVSAKSGFRIESAFRYDILKITADTPISARLWSLGLNFGYQLNF